MFSRTCHHFHHVAHILFKHTATDFAVHKKRFHNFSNCETCYNTASGCPCFGLRATPLGIGKTVRRLSPAVFRLTGAFTPCYGHGLDHQRRQARQRSDKPYHLDNQVHGQLTSSLRERRCQHTGLIPLTSSNYTIKSNIRSLFAHTDSDRKAA